MISIHRRLALLTDMCFISCQFYSSTIIIDLGVMACRLHIIGSLILYSHVSLSSMKIMLCIYSGRSSRRK